MLVIDTLRQSKKWLLILTGLLAMPVYAQQQADPQPPQSNSQPQAAATQSSAQQPGGTPAPAAPEPKNQPSPSKSLPSPTDVDYSKPAKPFPNLLRPYLPRTVPSPVFTNAPKIDELLQNGKVMLSMDDAIALALADNLDIAIARYNLSIADTDILLTKAGAQPRGVNAGVVQGTPGGGVGGVGTGAQGAGAGGTSAGAGGAGAGASGIVSSASGAGPQPDNFDPVLSGTLSEEHARFPVSNAITIGTNSLAQNQGTANFGLSQGFSTGTLFNITYDNSRAASSNRFNIVNPLLNSSFRASVRQHLLQGFGPSINRRFIVQARNSKKITEEGFRNQIITTVSQIQNIYWDLVNAYEDVKVKERSLALAQKTFSDNKKQVEIGTLAPIEIVRAQSTVAADEQALLTSRTQLQLQELTIKNAITRNLPNGSPLLQAEIVPTDTVQVPEQENLPPVQELIQQALNNRPDYNQQKINLKNQEITIKGANNGLLPTLDLVAFYGASSLAGPPNSLNPTLCGNPGANLTTCTVAPVTTGFGDTFTNLFNSSAPDKGLQLTLSIPIRNRAAQAVQIRSQLEYRQSQLNLKQFENQVAIQVRNDEFAVEQDRASVVSAQEAQRLQQQTLDAEQKKYALGASTYFNVLSAQRDLAQAESNVVAAITAYAKARVQLDKDTAQTLERNGISLDDAVLGKVKNQPSVPGLIRNDTLLQAPPEPTQQMQTGPTPVAPGQAQPPAQPQPQPPVQPQQPPANQRPPQ
jgi:outer membrane protein TolC